MNHQLFGDRPISHPQDDAFGFATFADSLATSLLVMSPTDGLVISIEGPWGAGKSSAIALTVRTVKLRVLSHIEGGREELEKLSEVELSEKWEANCRQRKVHFIRFNPWNFSGQENLVRAFFKELSSQIDAKPKSYIKRKLNKIREYLPPLLGGFATSGALLSGSTIPGIAAAAGALGRAIGEVGQRAFDFDTSIEVEKKKLADILRGSDERITVIIDDIDRLMPVEMRAILSLVKSLGDLPNVIYLMAFDPTVVHKGLADSTEKIDPAFLEKIVQVSLKLPPPWRAELRQYFFSLLNPIIGDAEPANLDRWQRMLIEGIEPYLSTPRDVVRLVNSLRVIWPTVSGDVDLTDLIALTTLQLFETDVYNLIKDEIEVITYANYRYENDEEFGARLNPDFADNKPAAKEIMALLFPRIASAWKHTMASMFGDNVIQKAHRRLCTKEYYRKYFTFGRDPRMTSRAEVEEIVLSPEPARALSQALKVLAGAPTSQRPSRIAVLIDQIGEILYERPLLTPKLIRAILDCSDELIRREDEMWELFVTYNQDRLEKLVRFGVSKLDAPKRPEILDVLVNHGTGLQLRASLIEREAKKLGLFGGAKEHESEWLFAPNEIEAAALAICNQIVAACEDGSVWKAPNPIQFVWARWRLGDKEHLSEWLTRVFADDEMVVQFAEQLLSRSYQTIDGKPQIIWVFVRESYDKLFDIDALYERLDTLSVTSPRAATIASNLRSSERNKYSE